MIPDQGVEQGSDSVAAEGRHLATVPCFWLAGPVPVLILRAHLLDWLHSSVKWVH